MLRPQAEDLAFRLFVANYLRLYNEKMKAETRSVTDVEIENVTDRLYEEYAAGNLLLTKVEAGLREAAGTLLYHLKTDEIPADDLVEFLARGQLVVVPAWYRCYAAARATIEMYRATTHQPPL